MYTYIRIYIYVYTYIYNIDTRLILPKDALPTSRLAKLEVVRVRLLSPRRAQTVGPS